MRGWDLAFPAWPSPGAGWALGLGPSPWAQGLGPNPRAQPAPGLGQAGKAKSHPLMGKSPQNRAQNRGPRGLNRALPGPSWEAHMA